MFLFDDATTGADTNQQGQDEKIKMDIQLFASESEGAEDGSGSDDANSDANGEDIELPKTIEELQKLLQSETDKRVTQALKTAQAKWEADFTKQLESEKKEAERLAKLSAAEKEKELLKKQQNELEKKEKDIALREMKLESVKILSEKSLPVEFVDLLTTDDADSTKENIETFEKAFRAAVEKSVDEKLKGGTPKKGSTEVGGVTDFIATIKENQVKRN